MSPKLSLCHSLCHLMEGTEEVQENRVKGEPQEVLESILEKFADVFKEPTGLPPPRAREHNITLQL